MRGPAEEETQQAAGGQQRAPKRDALHVVGVHGAIGVVFDTGVDESTEAALGDGDGDGNYCLFRETRLFKWP